MKDDYRLQGPTSKMQIDVEKAVAEMLEGMAAHTKLSVSELANTAIKRFISHHMDFMPPKKKVG